MKATLLAVAAVFLTTSLAHATIKMSQVKSVVCQSVAYYEEATPNQKTPAQGFKIFRVGSRSDVKSSAGAFLLAEYQVGENGRLQDDDNQHYYFSPLKDGKTQFAFIADWKANGELTVNEDGTATGYLNQKSHVTDLSCVLK